MKKYLLLIGLIIAACEPGPVIVFDQPQPKNVRDLKSFPHKYRGVYSIKDSAFLFISKKNIVSKYSLSAHITKPELDSFPYLKYSGNKIENEKTGEVFHVITKGNTISWKETTADTVFTISDQFKIRKFKGYIVLNFMIDTNVWEVKILQLKSGTLQFTEIGSKTDLDKIKTIVKPKVKLNAAGTDTLKLILQPTRSEFRDLLKIKDYKLQTTYKKIQ